MNTRRFAYLLILGLLAAPNPASSQRLGASYSLASSGHPELEDPRGVAAFARLPVGPDWFFRVAFSRKTKASLKNGRVCASYVPHIGCGLELVDTDLSLTSLQLGAYRPVVVSDHAAIYLGGGGSFNLLGGDAEGESGRKADLLVPKGGQVGGFGGFSISILPIPRYAVALEAGYRLHWIKFATCSGGDPPQYDPFCDPGTFHEFDLGLSFPFR